jgi:hypothetical protein
VTDDVCTQKALELVGLHTSGTAKCQTMVREREERKEQETAGVHISILK